MVTGCFSARFSLVLRVHFQQETLVSQSDQRTLGASDTAEVQMKQGGKLHTLATDANLQPSADSPHVLLKAAHV